MRILERHDIPYQVVEFPDTMRDAEEIAATLGIPAYWVYKTLVIEPVGVPGSKPFLALLAADRQLDLKKMAAAAGCKKVAMASHSDAERLTGLKVGGISPLALLHKRWAVYLDQPATQLEYILISGGQRGVDLRVPTLRLIALIHAKIVDVSVTI